MACVPPVTRSLGYVFLDYTTNGFALPHRMRLRLTYPIDPSDLTTIEGEAAIWATRVAACLPTNSRVEGWGTMNQDGSVFHIAAWPGPYVGTHAAALGAEDYHSRTITLTGKGAPPSGGVCGGQTRVVLFVGKAFNFIEGQKRVGIGFDGDLDALRDFLTGNSVLGADWYGTIGSWRPSYPVQFNAWAQRHIGS